MPKNTRVSEKRDYPHIEEKRVVKIWVKKPGRSFQMSVEGIGGRFYGALGRKMDGSTVEEILNPVSKKGKANLALDINEMTATAKKALLAQLLGL